MRIFISYSSPDRPLAEEIQLALLGEGHDVFFDKESLPPGGEYHKRIKSAIILADAFIFLITKNSVEPGSYALTELKFFRMQWPHPNGRLLPVRLDDTPWGKMPAYLKSVTVLEPFGNVAAEVLAAVSALPKTRDGFSIPNAFNSATDEKIVAIKKASSVNRDIVIAVIGLIGALGAAIIANWDKFFYRASPLEATSGFTGTTPSEEITRKPPRSETEALNTTVQNSDCPEVTVTDYTRYPPESKIIRKCDP